MRILRSIVLFVCLGSVLACSDSPTGPGLPDENGDNRPPPNKPSYGQVYTSPSTWLV